MAAAVGPPGTSLYQGVEKSSFGFKLLENLGWKEGDGLGANKQGIKEHVKVKKKYDALGVGAAEQVHRNRDWTTGMMSYDMILSGLKEISNKRAADTTNDHRSSGSDDDSGSASASASESEASDDAQPAPPKAKRHKPTQAAAKHNKRIAAASSSSGSDSSSSGSDSEAEASTSTSSSSSSDSDSSSSSSSDSDADVPATAAARTAKLATHVGRYRRREAAKHVRGYSATDLAAILGASAEEAMPPAAAAHAAASESSSSDGSDSSDSEGSSEERMRPATPSLEAPLSGSSGRAEQPRAGAAASSADKDGAQMPARKWWGSVFVSAGRMGSKGSALRPVDAKPKVTVNGFSEQDQTNLYMQAHDGKTQNRQGLGRSEMPKKVGGVRWAGTKTKIGDSSDEEEDAEDEQARQQRQEDEDAEAERRAAAEEAAAGIVIIMPKQRKAAAPAAPAQAADATTAATAAASDAAVGAEAEPVKGKKRKAALSDAEQQAAKKSKQQIKVQQAREQQHQQQQQQQQQPAQHAEQLAAGKTEKRSKRQAGANSAAQQPVVPAAVAIAIPVPAPAPVVVPTAAAKAAGPSAAGKDIKWRKVALRILAAAPKRRMRARKLLKLAVEAAGLGKEGEGQLQHMLGTLRRSASKFDVSEKFVSLVAEC